MPDREFWIGLLGTNLALTLGCAIVYFLFTDRYVSCFISFVLLMAKQTGQTVIRKVCAMLQTMGIRS